MLKKSLFLFLILFSLLLLTSCAQLPPDTKQNNLNSARATEKEKFNTYIELEISRHKESREFENSLNDIFQENDPSKRLNKIEQWLQASKQSLSPQKQPHIWILLNLLSADAHSRLRENVRSNDQGAIIKHYEKALQVISHVGYPLQTAAIQNNLAEAYIALPEDRRVNYIEKAINLANQALKVRTRREFPEDWAKTQIILAKAFHERSLGDKVANLKKSAEFFEQVLEVQTRKRLPDDFLLTVYELSQVLLELEQYPKALAYIEKALEANEYQLQQSPSYVKEQLLTNQAESLFSSAIWAASQMQDYEKALQLMEWGKGRILRKKHNSDRHEKNQFLTNQMESLFPNTILAASQMQDYKRLLLPMELGTEDILPRRNYDSDRLASFLNNNFTFNPPPDIFSIYQWLSKLPGDSTIIAPIFSNQGTIIFILPAGLKNISEENIITIRDFTRSDLHTLIRGENRDEWGGYIAYYADLKNKINQFAAADEQELSQRKLETHMAYVLSTFSQRWLNRTIERQQQLDIRRNSRLIWILDSDSGLLPIHSITYQDQPLLALYTVHFAPSIYSAFIAHKNLAKKKNDHLLAIIDPDGNLRGARRENKLINRYFESKKELFQGDATLANYNQEMRKFSPAYIHFASHGNYDWRNPLESGLKLSDQILTINDLIKKPTSYLDGNRLVVLSACETSLVDISMPSESVGIPLAFLQAGAPGVISTLWPVNDTATATLMAKFYQFHINDSLEPAKALRKAQLWLRSASYKEINKVLGAKIPNEQDVPFKDRYYWAGFVYSGM